MKTIGIIGGMSWESTATYYRLINECVKSKLGGLHSAKLILYSVDFAEIEKLQKSGDWASSGQMLNAAAKKLVLAGADVLGMCTNTMHKVAAQICLGIDIPFVHIAVPTAKAIVAAGHTKVGLLGTRFTMEESFYIDELVKFGLSVEVPNVQDRNIIHEIIFDELCRGAVLDESRRKISSIVLQLKNSGATAVILGCTELGMLLDSKSAQIPLYDTTELHARALVEAALD